jgi:hypothetical protein
MAVFFILAAVRTFKEPWAECGFLNTAFGHDVTYQATYYQ